MVSQNLNTETCSVTQLHDVYVIVNVVCVKELWSLIMVDLVTGHFLFPGQQRISDMNIVSYIREPFSVALYFIEDGIFDRQ